nr:Crp/Fnr family transcriptional regulator [Bacillus massilionigeriensis]
MKKIEKGTFLFQEDEWANELFVVLSGKVQISKMIPDGRELTIRMCRAGDLIGEVPLFDQPQKYMLNAKVIENGHVAVIDRQDLEKKLGENHQLSLEFMKWLNHQYRKNQTKFRDLVLNGKKGALYSTLIRLSNSYGEKCDDGILINIPITNQELANFCGTSREVVNRMLSELRRQKIVTIDKSIITIHDLSYLKKEIDCENCPVDICNID